MSYTLRMRNRQAALWEQFEAERRHSVFLSFLAGCGIGIIATDIWIAPWAGVPGGLMAGLLAGVSVFAYETYMWRHRHGG